jgi:hypothetical protein
MPRVITGLWLISALLGGLSLAILINNKVKWKASQRRAGPIAECVTNHKSPITMCIGADLGADKRCFRTAPVRCRWLTE